jgi:hypothetical protein
VCSRTSTSHDLLVIVALAVGTVGCKGGPMTEKTPAGSAETTSATGPAPARGAGAAGAADRLKPAVLPTVRAQKVIEAQVAAFKANSDASLAGTFDKDAVVLARTGHEVDEGLLARTLAQVGPHERVLEVKLNNLVAGGNDDAVWLMAELAIAKQNEEPEAKPSTTSEVIRATELIAASAGWKVVAAAFSDSRKPGRLGATFPMLDTTAAGPLAPMLAAPAKLADALAADPSVVVIPPEDPAAVGPHAARALLATYAGRKLVVDGAARELHSETWGFAQANVSWLEPGGSPYRLTAQLIALPAPNGSWAIVAVQFLAL